MIHKAVILILAIATFGKAQTHFAKDDQEKYKAIPFVREKASVKEKKVIKCGSLEHQKNFELFFDALSRGELSEEHLEKYNGKAKRLFWGFASISLQQLLFGLENKEAEDKFENLFDEVFSCAESAAWLEKIVASIKTKSGRPKQ